MRFFISIFHVVSACALFLLASPAQAVTINVTVKGVVTDVKSTNSNVFDGIGIGDAFSVTYAFNLNDAAFVTYDSAAGGLQYGGGPFGSAHIQIGTHSFFILGNMSAFVNDYGVVLWQYVEQYDESIPLITSINTIEDGSFAGNIVLPSSDDDLQPPYFSNATFQIYDPLYSNYSILIASLDSVTAAPASAPEPATLSLFVGGVFATRIARRRNPIN